MIRCAVASSAASRATVVDCSRSGGIAVIPMVHRFLYTRVGAATHRSSSTLYSRCWSQGPEPAFYKAGCGTAGPLSPPRWALSWAGILEVLDGADNAHTVHSAAAGCAGDAGQGPIGRRFLSWQDHYHGGRHVPRWRL